MNLLDWLHKVMATSLTGGKDYWVAWIVQNLHFSVQIKSAIYLWQGLKINFEFRASQSLTNVGVKLYQSLSEHWDKDRKYFAWNIKNKKTQVPCTGVHVGLDKKFKQTRISLKN